MILKIKKNAKEWVSFYAQAIKNRLRRDLNLSDVTDVEEARNNLELVGDNNCTHYHDSRYLPLIKKETDDRDAATKLLSEEINSLKLELKRLEEIKANLENPHFLGAPNAPTPNTADNSNRIATTAFTQNIANNLNNRINSIFDAQGRLRFPNGNLFWIG